MPNDSEIAIYRTPKTFGRGTLVGDDPAILDLTPEQRLLVSGWHHACPRPTGVSKQFNVEWTRHRYDDCDFIFKSIICENAKRKPELYILLISPTPRLPDEPVGVFEEGAVPPSHRLQMSPLSTLPGYALSRVFAEQAGRGNQRTAERYFLAMDLLDEAIDISSTPMELLVNLTAAAVAHDADPLSVLSHVLEPEILREENCPLCIENLSPV